MARRWGLFVLTLVLVLAAACGSDDRPTPAGAGSGGGTAGTFVVAGSGAGASGSLAVAGTGGVAGTVAGSGGTVAGSGGTGGQAMMGDGGTFTCPADAPQADTACTPAGGGGRMGMQCTYGDTACYCSRRSGNWRCFDTTQDAGL